MARGRSSARRGGQAHTLAIQVGSTSSALATSRMLSTTRCLDVVDVMTGGIMYRSAVTIGHTARQALAALAANNSTHAQSGSGPFSFLRLPSIGTKPPFPRDVRERLILTPEDGGATASLSLRRACAVFVQGCRSQPSTT